MATEKPPTLFPKISGKHADFIANIQWNRLNSPPFPKTNTIPLIGTVKLHGTHNDIVIHADTSIQLQSRNKTNLSLESNPYNFAKTMLPLTNEILALKEKIHDRFKKKNPGVEINADVPLIIAGEWIGPGIQKGVATNLLPAKIFVIISLSLNNTWLPDLDYCDVQHEEVGIYNVSRGGFFRYSIPMENVQAGLEALQPFADAVERECPFAKSFGIVGAGEGVVWKVALEPLQRDPRFWIKVKGPVFSGVPRVKNKGVGEGEKEVVRRFAEAVVNERRLEQGLEYLLEMGVRMDKKGVRWFLDWVWGDVVAEEGREIEEVGVERGVLKRICEAMAREWYFGKAKEAEKDDLVIE